MDFVEVKKVKEFLHKVELGLDGLSDAGSRVHNVNVCGATRTSVDYWCHQALQHLERFDHAYEMVRDWLDVVDKEIKREGADSGQYYTPHRVD